MVRGINMLTKFKEIYRQTGAAQEGIALKELMACKYELKDPVSFVSKWERKLTTYILSTKAVLDETCKVI